MNDRQYRHALRNGRRRYERAIGETGVDPLVRQVAGALRRRERAEAAWEMLAPRELRDRAQVVSYVDGRLSLVAPDRTARTLIRRRGDAILRALRARLRDLSAIGIEDAETRGDDA